MKAKDWQKINEIVIEALELDLPQRREFIEKYCAGQPEIRREVESLLANEDKVEDFFGESAAINYAGFFDKSEDPEALVGQEIGNYRIIREIGSGGMGAVYLAERADGKFTQKVALKLLKREMNTSALRRRFQQERAILASLEHPNIARLLDAGTTDDKIPFLAMEYVEGLPIDEYCAANNLNLEERLDLFRKVCSTVNFAHRNLIVHRDLKPSNIFVNDEGVPKLIDFGISKIISAEFEQVNSATVTKLGVMTPSYASPEQLKNESVTTSTDIYSLGVILYELLSGHRPFEAKEQDLKEIYKAVIESNPPLPSSIIKTVSTSKAEREEDPEKPQSETKINQGRHTSPSFNLIKPQYLRGDLDNIVLKALKKEPDRRYSSAENFSEDIRRHQMGLPVLARPDTFSYRAEKFIKRHQAGVFAGMLILLAIIAGIVATLWQARVAAAERDRAQRETKKVNKINDYTQNILNFSNPHWMSSNPKRNRDAKISDALDEALKNIDTDLGDEPEIQAEILSTIGQTYSAQGQYEKAREILSKAKEKFNQVSDTATPKSMQTSVLLAGSLQELGKYEEAKKLYIEAINYFRPKVSEDESHIKWLAIALNNLANPYAQTGKLTESEASVRESLEFAKQLTGKNRFMIPVLLLNLGSAQHQKGNFPPALDFFNQALEELRASGNEESFDGGNVNMGIARTYNSMKDFKTADVYYQKSYEILVKAVGEEHPTTLGNRMLFVDNCYKQEKYDEAKAAIEEILKIQRKLYPNGHHTIAFSRRLLGVIYTQTGELKKGETEIREALEMLSKTYKEPSQDVSLLKRSLGENLIAQKRFDEAGEVLTSALDGYVKTFGEEHPVTKKCRELLSSIPAGAKR